MGKTMRRKIGNINYEEMKINDAPCSFRWSKRRRKWLTAAPPPLPLPEFEDIFS